MANGELQDGENQITPLKKFFLGRQPIFGRSQNLVAYELLFRRAASGAADVTDDLSATATVIAHASELGMGIVIGNALGLINVDAAVLMSDFVKFLPREKIILEILESVEATPEIIARITELAQLGFRFALDDVINDSENVQKFLPLVEIVKIDVMGMEPSVLLSLSTRFRLAQKKMVAEKVEDLDQFKACMELGFDYFQGYYFAKPVILSGKKIEPSELGIMQLMALIGSDADNQEVEACIKQNVTISLNLLRLVNTPAAGARQRIGSLSQAMMILGRRHLYRWLQILLYAKPSKGGLSTQPLLLLASTRGKLLELLAQKLHPGKRAIADTAFTVGIMSLMDTLFGVSMAEILTQISVVDEVSDALLRHQGLYGDMLKLAQYIEHIDETCPLMQNSLNNLQLPIEDFYLLELAAFEWANNVANSMH
jgi:EAL and modified HD-GYP domain-containing signal transduction protein